MHVQDRVIMTLQSIQAYRVIMTRQPVQAYRVIMTRQPVQAYAPTVPVAIERPLPVIARRVTTAIAGRGGGAAARAVAASAHVSEEVGRRSS